MPNIGRESSTYLKFIVDNYDTLDGMYFFVQGNPFDHAPQAVERINNTPLCEYIDIGSYEYICDGGGSPQHSGLPLREAFLRFIKSNPPEQYRFFAGAQFGVSAQRLKSHTKEFYQDLYMYACDHPQGPWVLERLWKYIWA